MYCIKCGVELADSEKICPLCETVVFHPDLPTAEGTPLYPEMSKAQKTASRTGWMTALSMVVLLPMVIALWTDVSVNGKVAWSDVVIGAVSLFYVIVMLPMWFEKNYPVVFVPIDFGAVLLFLLYLNQSTDGDWFLSFAFPIVGTVGLIFETVLTLMIYLRRGRLYVIGGTIISIGCLSVLVELLLNVTFYPGTKLFWSVYPLSGCVILGLIVILTASNRSMREWLHKKLFF